MSADYTIWKPSVKERFLLWDGAWWDDVLNISQCVLTKLTINRNELIEKLMALHATEEYAIEVADKIISFCGDDEIVITSDCGTEYFDEEDIFNGIKDTYTIVGER